MKKIKLITSLVLTSLTLITSGNAIGKNVSICAKEKGSIIFDSATELGNSVIIVNPRIYINEKIVAGIATEVPEFHSGTFVGGYTVNADALSKSGTSICKAIGYSGGKVSDFTKVNSNSLLAEFDENGNLISVGRGIKSKVVKIVSCLK